MNVKFLGALMLGFILFVSCQVVPQPKEENIDYGELDNQIFSMNTLATGETFSFKQVVNTNPADVGLSPDPIWGTNFKIVKVTEGRIHDMVKVIEPTGLWLGQILDARRLPENKYDEIALKRKPYRFKVENLNVDIVRATADGTSSGYGDALRSILRQNLIRPESASTLINNYTIYSEKDIDFSIGLGLGIGKTSLSSYFNWNDRQVRSRIIIEYYQTLFSVEMDLPTKPSDLFDPSVTFKDLTNYAGTTCPLYIYMIVYGRVGYLFVESYASETETKAALNAAFKSRGLNANFGVSVGSTEILSNVTVKGFVAGGDIAASSDACASVENFMNWIKITNRQDKATGVPLYFRMRYLGNNREAEIYKVYNTYRLEYTGTNAASSSSSSSSSSGSGVNKLIINGSMSGGGYGYSTGDGSASSEFISGQTILQIYNSNNICIAQVSGNPAVYDYYNVKPSDTIKFVSSAVVYSKWEGRGGRGETNFTLYNTNSIKVSDILNNTNNIISGKFTFGYNNFITNSYIIQKE